jgi:F-box and WD-40 domain protein 1/11
MTPPDTSVVRPVRRRPSLLLSRTRPKTANLGDAPDTTTALPWMSSGPWAPNPSYNNGAEESSGLSYCQDEDHMDSIFLQDISEFPEPRPRHRSAKSFSSIRHGVDGLRAFGRRLSVTIRGKSSRHVSHEGDREVDAAGELGGTSPDGKHRNAWFKEQSINRRPSLHSVSALQTFYAPTANMANFIPGMGFEPPVFTDELCGGAAARAAAAAQNKSSRNISAADSKIFDSESGIGIDLRSSDGLSDSEPSISRIGEYYPVQSCIC